MKIHKNLFGTNGEDKIDVDEIAFKDLEGILRLLGWAIIVESGSNANGEYLRFGNGWQVCLLRASGNIAINSSWGSIFYGSFSYQTFPKSFVEKPYVFILNASSGQAFTSMNTPTLTRTGTIELYRGVSTAAQDRDVSIMAIGKWK